MKRVRKGTCPGDTGRRRDKTGRDGCDSRMGLTDTMDTRPREKRSKDTDEHKGARKQSARHNKICRS